MEIGYSIETLRFNLANKLVDVESETRWLRHYYQQKDSECMEDCIRNIQDSLTAMLEDIELLKGENM
jgi:Mg2+ and Co2+ transporter CorA